MAEELRISMIQSHIIWEDQEENLCYYGELLRRVSGRTDLAVLPETFTTEQFDAIAPQLNIAKSTSWRHLRLFLYQHGLVQRLSQGNYRKVCTELLK